MPSRSALASGLYLELIRKHPLRPVRSDSELDSAIAMVDTLTNGRALTPDEEDYLEVLSRLIEDYEHETNPLPEMSGVEALRYLLDVNKLTQARLSGETKIPVATISEILNEDRKSVV